MKKIVFWIVICANTTVFAATCLTVKQIKHCDFQGWRAFLTVNAEPAPTSEMMFFIHTVNQFYQAVWDGSTVGVEPSGQCYYYSHAEVYLAKAQPKPVDANWKWLDSNYAQCLSNVANCVFGDRF